MKNPLANKLDMAFINGSVITVDAQDSIQESLGIIGNRIAIIGSTQDLEPYISEDTKVIDLKGRTLMPGINDTHFHPILGGMLGTDKTDGMLNTTKEYCPTLKSLLNLIEKTVADREPGEWISTMGYEPELFEDEQRHPTIEELDAIAPNNPVHCMHGGGHVCMYNSKALEYLEIYGPEDAKKFPKDEVEVVDGKLTGQLRGHTHFLLWGMVDYTEEQLKKAAMVSYQKAIESGITSIGDMGETGQTSYHVMQKLTRDRKFKVRLNMALHSIFGKPFSLEQNKHFHELGFMTGLGNEYFRVGPSKFMIDGGSTGPSCLTREPYSHDPTMVRESGWEREEVKDYIQEIVDAECQATAHAIGDGAVEYMVEGYEAAFEKAEDKEAFKEMRHRIERCTLADQDLIERMAKMNIIPSVNAGMVSYVGANYMKFYGDRNKYLGALRSMLDAGMKPSLHSDYPSGPIGLKMLDGAINRYDRSKNVQCDNTQAISVMEAIRVATYNGAYSTWEEDIKGSLEPGKLADVIILSDNILEIDPMDINKVYVDMTLIDGEIVYKR